jgi:hypothetical protein
LSNVNYVMHDRHENDHVFELLGLKHYREGNDLPRDEDKIQFFFFYNLSHELLRHQVIIATNITFT